jgi:hypothetical protein
LVHQQEELAVLVLRLLQQQQGLALQHEVFLYLLQREQAQGHQKDRLQQQL